MNITTFFTIAGGVALFLYGIKLLSASLQNLAGDKLRQLLGELTKTPLRGIIVGIIVTVLIQSSAGTTVMTVSFVNNGLLILEQALGLIMGANIGTTVTAQLLAFNIGTLAYRNKKARLEVSRTFSSWLVVTVICVSCWCKLEPPVGFAVVPLFSRKQQDILPA